MAGRCLPWSFPRADRQIPDAIPDLGGGDDAGLEALTGATPGSEFQVATMRAGGQAAIRLANSCRLLKVSKGLLAAAAYPLSVPVRLDNGPGYRDYPKAPHGLSARELESYLREHAAEICHTAQRPAGSRAEVNT